MSTTVAGLIAVAGAFVSLCWWLIQRPMRGCVCGRCRRSHTPVLRCVVPPGTSVWLEFRSGPMGGNSVQLTERHTTIGSVANNDIVLSDPAVSQEHLQIDRKSGSFTLRDRGSTNGVFVNGRRRKQQVLASDDIIQLGNSEVIFRFV